MKKLLILSGITITLIVTAVLSANLGFIFITLSLPAIWMYSYRNIRAGWFWLIFLGTGTLIGLKAELIILEILLGNAFISLMVTSINFSALIFAIRRSFFVKRKDVEIAKQETEHELDTSTNTTSTIKNKQLY